MKKKFENEFFLFNFADAVGNGVVERIARVSGAIGA